MKKLIAWWRRRWHGAPAPRNNPTGFDQIFVITDEYKNWRKYL